MAGAAQEGPNSQSEVNTGERPETDSLPEAQDQKVTLNATSLEELATTSESRVKPIPGFVEKVESIKESTEQHLTQSRELVARLRLPSPSAEEVDHRSVISELQEIIFTKPPYPEGFLDKTTTALAHALKAYEQLQNRKKELGSEDEATKDKILELGKQLNSRFGKLFHPKQWREAKQQLEQAQIRRAKIGDEEIEIQERVPVLNNMFPEAEYRHKEGVLQGLQEELSSLNEARQELRALAEVSPEIRKELNRSLMRNVVEPVVIELVQLGNLPQDKLDRFKALAEEYIKSGSEQESEARKQVALFLHNELADVNSVFPKISSGYKWQAQGVNLLVNTLARKGLLEFKDIIDAGSGTFEVSGHRSEYLNNLKIQSRAVLFEELDLPSTLFYLAVRNSPTLQAAFQSELKELDLKENRQNRQALLVTESPLDYDMAVLSPTPKDIRDLVLIAASDQPDILRMHALGLLKRLQTQPEWQEKFREASYRYPSLSTAGNFANEERSDPELISLMLQELSAAHENIGFGLKRFSSGLLADVLLTRKQITSEQALALKAVEPILKGLQQKADEVESGAKKDFNQGKLNEALRGTLNLPFLLTNPDNWPSDTVTLQRMAELAQFIKDQEQNPDGVYLVSRNEFLEKLKEAGLDTASLFQLAQEYSTLEKALPEETWKQSLLCFKDKESAKFLNNFYLAYADFPVAAAKCLKVVNQGQIGRERVLELPEKAPDILSSEADTQSQAIAFTFPELFLKTDTGITAHKLISDNDFFKLSAQEEGLLTSLLAETAETAEREVLLFNVISDLQAGRINKLLNEGAPDLKANWQNLLTGYLRARNNGIHLPGIGHENKQKIINMFRNSELADVSLNGYREEWISFLNDSEAERLPFSLDYLSREIGHCGNTGNMTQIAALSKFVNTVRQAYHGEELGIEEKQWLKSGLSTLEAAFTKGKWSHENRSDFYNISGDLLNADPRLLTNFLDLFTKLSPADLKSFSREIYPLFRVKLALLERRDTRKDTVSFDPVQLDSLRESVVDLVKAYQPGRLQTLSLDELRAGIVADITSQFQTRFGINKVPQEFEPRHMEMLSNFSTYLANLHNRKPEHEDYLGFYLALHLNGQWQDFRTGKQLDLRALMTEEKVLALQYFLEARGNNSPLTANNLGLASEAILQFQELLQEEVSNTVESNYQTVDVILNNIRINTEQLTDRDLYKDAFNWKRMELLFNNGNELVAGVAVKYFQQLSGQRQPEFNEKEAVVKDSLTRILQENGLEVTADNIKRYFQTEIKPLSMIANLVELVRASNLEQETAALSELRKPGEEISALFNSLGESFTPHSGADALSLDLNYLDNLIVKQGNTLSQQQRSLLQGYVARIRTKLGELQGVYEQIRNKTSKLGQLDLGAQEPQIKDQLEHILSIVNGQEEATVIRSILSSDFNDIIPNMRECLSCNREGENNDTVVSLGDSNKFYLFSTAESQPEGSIADQIIYLEPVTYPDGSSSISFVMDRLYGTSTPIVLNNHLETVLTKVSKLKGNYPQARLSVFLPYSTLATGGVIAEDYLVELKDRGLNAEIEKVTVNIAASAASDHYIEFGSNTDSARDLSPRQVEGITIRFP